MTSAKTIRAILIQPGTSGCVDDIEDTLPTFQRIVGGYIEVRSEPPVVSELKQVVAWVV